MVVNFYNFSKRPNSTKQPAANDATKLVLSNVELKDECSFLNPVLLVTRTMVTGFNPTMYNYVYIPGWTRYYNIKDWTYKNAVWEVSLSVDVLASFKSSIGSTSAYVLRSASASDGNIIDTLYPAKPNATIQKANVACAWYNVAPSGGTYVVGILNYEDFYRVGAVSYYALTMAQFNSFLAYLFSNNIYNASSVTEISAGLYKSLFNPFQYIVSCMWFPFSSVAFADPTVNVKNIKLGYWDTGIQGLVVGAISEKTYVTATLPDHPQAAARGAYLNRAPYTRMTLYIPPFGSIPLDMNYRSIGNYLYSAVQVDHITGMATIRVAISASSSNLDEFNIMTERTGMLGVPIQISQLMPDYVGSIQTITSGIGSLVTGNILGAASSVLSAVETQMPKVSSNGANGSFVECLLAPHLIAEFLPIADEDNTEFGRPLCSARTLSTLSGYIQCSEDDHAFPCTEPEKTLINQHLKNGFFYE